MVRGKGSKKSKLFLARGRGCGARNQAPTPEAPQGELVLLKLGAGPQDGLQPSPKAFTICRLGRPLEAGEAEQAGEGQEQTILHPPAPSKRSPKQSRDKLLEGRGEESLSLTTAEIPAGPGWPGGPCGP